MSRCARSLLVLACWMLVACTQSEAPATPTPTLAPQLAQGKQLFSLHCASCHAVESNTVIVGPSLSGVADRADEREPQMTAHEYVERSILQPGAFVVPGFDNLMPENLGKRLDGEELDAIVAYVMSLQ